jgi:hypothetical protein
MDSFYSYNNAVQQSLGSYNTLHEQAQEKMATEAHKEDMLNTPLEVIGGHLSHDALLGLKDKAGKAATKVASKALNKVGLTNASQALEDGKGLQGAINGGVQDTVGKVQDLANKGMSKATQAVTDASNTAQDAAETGISKVTQSATDAQSSAKSISTDFTKSTATMSDPSMPTGGYSVGDATPSGKALRTYLQSDGDLSIPTPGRTGSSMVDGQTGGDSTIARATQNNTATQKMTFDDTDADPFSTPKTISSGVTTNGTTTSTMDSPNTLTNQASKIASTDIENVGTHATGASGLLGDAGDDSLDTLTEASTAFDENPLGDIITAALGIASIFAPMFEHHQKQSPINALNPASQFGESE